MAVPVEEARTAGDVGHRSDRRQRPDKRAIGACRQASADAGRGARTSLTDPAAGRMAVWRLPRWGLGRTGSIRPRPYSNLTNHTGHVTRRHGCRQLTDFLSAVWS